MSLKATVQRAIETAFTQAGDLVVDASLSNRTVSGYDFTTNQVVSTTQTLSVKALFYKDETYSKHINPQNQTSEISNAVIKLTDDEVDFKGYDMLTVGSDSYRIDTYEQIYSMVLVRLRRI